MVAKTNHLPIRGNAFNTTEILSEHFTFFLKNSELGTTLGIRLMKKRDTFTIISSSCHTEIDVIWFLALNHVVRKESKDQDDNEYGSFRLAKIKPK